MRPASRITWHVSLLAWPFLLAGIEVQQLAGATGDAEISKAAGSKKQTQSSTSAWSEVPEILRRIETPTFPKREFPIKEFGAVANTEADSTEAIRKAIEAAHKAGGGRVTVPEGEFRTGAIHLLSNVELNEIGRA